MFADNYVKIAKSKFFSKKLLTNDLQSAIIDKSSRDGKKKKN